MDTAPLLSSSLSTSGRAEGWGSSPRLQGAGSGTKGPLSLFPIQGVPLHVRGAYLVGLPRQARHHGPGGEWGCPAEWLRGPSLSGLPILPGGGFVFWEPGLDPAAVAAEPASRGSEELNRVNPNPSFRRVLSLASSSA